MTVTRSLGLVAAACLLVTGCGNLGTSDDAAATSACRAKFYALSFKGMTQPDATRLVLRNLHETEEAHRLSKQATAADCPDGLRAAARRIESLRVLLVAIVRADMADDLRQAEADLVHGVAEQDLDPIPARLAAAFRVLRSHAEPALKDLAGEIDRASRSDIDDPEAVKDAISALNAAARANANVAACQQAVLVISKYELREE